MTSIFPIAYGCSKFVSGVSGRAQLTASHAGWRAHGHGPDKCRLWLRHQHGLVFLFLGAERHSSGDPQPQCASSPVKGSTSGGACSPAPGLLARGHAVYTPELQACQIALGAGLRRPLLRAHPDVLVRHQGAGHVLGHVEHCAQSGRLQRPPAGRLGCPLPGLEVGCACVALARACSCISCPSRARQPLWQGPPPALPFFKGPSAEAAAGSTYVTAPSAGVACLQGGLLHAGMWAPGAVGLVIGMMLLLTVRDSPEKIGYPPVEVPKKREVGCSPMGAHCVPALPCTLHMPVVSGLQLRWECCSSQACCHLLHALQAKASTQPQESLLTLLLNNVLKNPYIWAMALTYFFIYVVRQGVTSWFVFYLIKVLPRGVGSLPRTLGAGLS